MFALKSTNIREKPAAARTANRCVCGVWRLSRDFNLKCFGPKSNCRRHKAIDDFISCSGSHNNNRAGNNNSSSNCNLPPATM